MNYYKKLEEKHKAIDEYEKDTIKKGLFTGLFFGGIVGGVIYSQLITVGAFITMFLLTWKRIM